MVFLFAQGTYNISGANTILGIRVRSIKRLNYHYVSTFEFAFFYVSSIVNFYPFIQSHFLVLVSVICHPSSMLITLNTHHFVSHASTRSLLIIGTYGDMHICKISYKEYRGSFQIHF